MSSTDKTPGSVQENYGHYTAADFASDDAFLNHHLSPNEQSTQFWQEWLRLHPHRRNEWQEGQQVLEAVRLGLSEYARTYLSEEAETRLLARIQATNALAKADTSVKVLRSTNWFNRDTMGWVAAACLVVGLGFSVWFFVIRSGSSSIYQQQVVNLSQVPIEQTNQTHSPDSVQLPDGSMAILFPKSRLSYPADFGEQNRTVFLLGKATFDVVKDPAKPFYVYAHELVTRVLGTRFTVEAFDQQKDFVDTVQQGQVNVYPNQSTSGDNVDQRALKGVVILPNQQVVFSRQNEQLTKKIVPDPVVLEAASAKHVSFVFEETAVAEAFDRIRKVYGINVIYNSDDLKGCQLTASLGDESLFQKLDVITQSIGATYQVVDGEIIILAKGCGPE